jgi:hypothetical protein
MKLILYIFEKLLGFKINFHMSEVYYFGRSKDSEEQCKYLFGCKEGSFAFKYLDILNSQFIFAN